MGQDCMEQLRNMPFQSPHPASILAEHFGAVRSTPAYEGLPRQLVDEVASTAAARAKRVMELLCIP